MKNLRITLGVAAIAIGSFAAFSFAPAKVDSKVALLEFYVNPDGSRGTQVSGKNQCNEATPTLCSQEYNTSTGQPTNDPNKMHYGIRITN
ncbi:hypothetical protein EGY07_11530 [Chryseobacterium indologenes]|jgi:hypothetical protein|uniref:hypothetical protein n=1 Tax=Chryseobacterium TaxID=59732 RepID=UPI0004858509|nr:MULTISPECIES: hypothetical protein [Chryseobacterium]AYZ36165.1 hypothetical protein EGY07_11530 [Chryseobacterium indologenes]MEB4760794.1 hypothetical protein [Chryseobacterium indologenes]